MFRQRRMATVSLNSMENDILLSGQRGPKLLCHARWSRSTCHCVNTTIRTVLMRWYERWYKKIETWNIKIVLYNINLHLSVMTTSQIYIVVLDHSDLYCLSSTPRYFLYTSLYWQRHQYRQYWPLICIIETRVESVVSMAAAGEVCPPGVYSFQTYSQQLLN